MVWIENNRNIVRQLADLLDYPRSNYLETLSDTITNLEMQAPDAALQLKAYKEKLGDLNLGAIEELHTKTFSVSPVCIPYLGVHLFGEQSPNRVQMMAKFSEKYSEKNFERSGELPDHAAVLIRFLPELAAEERKDLINFVLAPGLEKMSLGLKKSNNPYELLINACQTVFEKHRTAGEK
jgi:nitrate reductase assembly molybdenum cofactor insertion protein NarJ